MIALFSFILSFFFFFKSSSFLALKCCCDDEGVFQICFSEKKLCLHCVLSWKQISHWTDDRFPLYIIKQTIFRVTWGFVSLLILLFIIHSISIYEVSTSARSCSRHLGFSNDQIPVCVQLTF